MAPTMSALHRRIALLAAASLLSIALPWCTSPALADHGGALRSAPMSPLMVGAIAAALALGAGLAVLAIVRLFARKTPPRE